MQKVIAELKGNKNRGTVVMSKESKEQSNETAISSKEKFELRRLFLEAVLTEYKRLTEEMRAHSKNMFYIFAVMIAGVAAIAGFFDVIGTVSFLFIPIFISSCALLILSEGYGAASIEKYIKEEIECKELKKLFPEDSPIRWEWRPQNEREGAIFWLVLFGLTLFICFGFLISATLSLWSEVCSSMFYQLIYFFGWLVLISYVISAVFVFYKLDVFKVLLGIKANKSRSKKTSKTKN